MIDAVAYICGMGILLAFAIIFTVFLGGIAYSLVAGRTRAGAATPLNAESQYKDFLRALDTLQKKYSLSVVSRPDSFKSLTASCVARKECVLLSGMVKGKAFSVSAFLAGGSPVTQMSLSGKHSLPIDVVTSSALHLPSLGMEMRFMGGRQILAKKLSIRPEFDFQRAAVEKSLSAKFLARLEKMIFLKPRVFNLSSQLVEVYEKKYTALKDKAFIRDYGLFRDSKYAVSLASEFISFSCDWEKSAKA